MIEVLVLSLCIGGYECNTALKAAYAGKPEYKQATKRVKNKAESALGRPTTVAIPAIVSIMMQKTLNIRLTKNLTAVHNSDTIKLVYGFSF
jgi:uncharacterized protein with gpF-like domain